MPVPSHPSLSKLSEILMASTETSTMSSDILTYTELSDEKLMELENSGAIYIKEIFTSSLFGGSRVTEQNITGVLVLLCIAFGLSLILLMCYFLIKICNLQVSHGQKLSTENITSEKYKDMEIIPSKVLYPKRIYEIQAEEGYYSCPPSIQQSLENLSSSSDKRPSIFDPNSAGPFVRKCRDSIRFKIRRKLTTVASEPEMLNKEKLRQIISANP